MNEPTQLMSPEDMKNLAEHAAKSGMFGLTNSSQAFCLFAICAAEGLNPVTALKRYHIIEGKPSMRSDAMLAEFIAKGGGVLWHIRSDSSVAATFFADAKRMDDKAIERAKKRYLALVTGDFKGASDQAHPGEDTILRTLADADTKGLSMCWKKGKDEKFTRERKTNWAQSPRQMLTARVITEGIRLIAPGIVAGVASPEDIEDSHEALPESAEAPPSRDLAAMQAVLEQHEENALAATTIADQKRFQGLAADMRILIQEKGGEIITQALRAGAKVLDKALPAKEVDDIPMEHSKAELPKDCKLVKGSEISQPKPKGGDAHAPVRSGDSKPAPTSKPESAAPASDSPFGDPEPDRQKADDARTSPSPAEPAAASNAGSGAQEEPYPTKWQDYKLRHVTEASGFLGKKLGDLSAAFIAVLYKKRSVPLLNHPEEKIRVEAKFIEMAHKASK